MTGYVINAFAATDEVMRVLKTHKITPIKIPLSAGRNQS
jgi:hypothetical protein